MPNQTSNQTNAPEGLGVPPLQSLLVLALEHFRDPVWLGNHSPLASPFFLGEFALNQRDLDPAKPADRGEALRRALKEIAVHLDEGAQIGSLSRRSFVELQYFADKPLPKQTLADVLGVSRAGLYRHLERMTGETAEILESHLVKLVNPSQRPERPTTGRSVGYSDAYSEILESLTRRQTVAIVGMGGIGKTTLGIRASHAQAADNSFWFTVRPGLNDSLQSMLFALAAFLRHRGTTALWSLIAARPNTPADSNIALGAFRYDVERLKERRLLFCFDEVDLLHADEYADHARLVAFLEGMRGIVPMLWIGQQIVLEADTVMHLDGLSARDVRELLRFSNILWSQEVIEAATAYSRGNPRVLELLIALHQSGDSVEDVFKVGEGLPSIEFLLNRIWRRLDEAEQDLICRLVVYRTPAPLDAFPAIVHRLAERRLVDISVLSGVSLSPLFRSIVLGHLSPAARQALHTLAAHVRAERGAYTEALHHFVLAGKPGLGIGLWFRYQAQEIDQGQADAAYRALNEIDERRLEPVEAEQLALLLGALQKLRGEYEQSAHKLRRTVWQSPVLKSLADRLEGDIADLTSDYTRAVYAYQQGLEGIARLLGERSLFHKNLAWATMRQGDLVSAWQHAQMAWYEAENMRGYISDELRRFDAAESYYRNALAIAKEMNHTQGIAKTSDNLAGLLARRGQFAEAQKLWRESEELFKRVGYVASRAGALVNQAYGYNLSGEHGDAIAAAESALEIFEHIGEAYGVAVAQQNLGEAYLGLRDWPKATKYAEMVLGYEDERIIPDALRVAGLAALGKENPARAHSLLVQAESVAREVADPYLDAYIQRDLGSYFLAIGDDEQARIRLGEAHNLFDSLGLPFEAERTRKMLISTPYR